MRLLKHLIGLTHARSRTDVNLQPAALGALDQFEKIFGAFTLFLLVISNVFVRLLMTLRIILQPAAARGRPNWRSSAKFDQQDIHSRFAQYAKGSCLPHSNPPRTFTRSGATLRALATRGNCHSIASGER